jgi:alpha-galactosidase
MKNWRIVFCLFTGVILGSIQFSYGQSTVKLLPTMGWEPWSISHCEFSEGRMYDADYYMRLMDLMEFEGFREVGYTYLIVECKDHFRDDDWNWMVNTEKFPGGYKPLVDYAHERGFKIKAYTDAGATSCCRGRCNDGGSYGFYEEDAMAWAGFDFDGVKIDWCGGRKQNLHPKTQFIEFYKAINKHIKKPFDVEVCCWGVGNPWEWGRFAGSMWRTSGDIDLIYTPPATSYLGGKWEALLRNIDENRHSDTSLVGPGKGYNYADMLLVGIPGGLTEIEERTQFSLWSIMASPLYLSMDLFNLPDYAKKILLNSEVVGIDQDPLGLQGDVIKESKDGNVQVWSKSLADNGKALAFFNRDSVSREITLEWSEIDLGNKVMVRDLWKQEDMGTVKKKMSVEIRPHETLLYKVQDQ